MAATIVPEAPEAIPYETAESSMLDMHAYPYLHPTYKSIKTAAPTVTDPILIDGTSRSTEHMITPCVFNPSKTQCRFDVKLVGAAPIATPFLWMTELVHPWTGVRTSFSSTSGRESSLMDQKFADVNVNLCAPFRTSKRKFMSSDRNDRLAPMREREPPVASTGVGNIPTPQDGGMPLIATSRAPTALLTPHVASLLNGAEQNYCRVWNLTGCAAADMPTMKMTCNMDQYADSFFSIDKNFPTAEPIKIELDWGQAGRYFWWGTDGANPLAGVAAFIPTATRYFTVTKFEFNVHVEQDKKVADMVKDLARRGLYKMPLSYTEGFKSTLAAGATHIIDRPLNKAKGQAVLRIYTSAYSAIESFNESFNHDNIDGTRVLTFASSVDGTKYQDNPLQCGGVGALLAPTSGVAPQYDDWRIMKDLLYDSVFQTRNQFQFSWGIIDDFSGVMREKDLKVDKENIVAGLPLTEIQSIYNVEMTTPGLLNNIYYQFVVYQRYISFVPDGSGAYKGIITMS